MWKKKRRSGAGLMAIAAIAVTGLTVFFMRHVMRDVIRYSRMHRM